MKHICQQGISTQKKTRTTKCQHDPVLSSLSLNDGWLRDALLVPRSKDHQRPEQQKMDVDDDDMNRAMGS